VFLMPVRLAFTILSWLRYLRNDIVATSRGDGKLPLRELR